MAVDVRLRSNALAKRGSFLLEGLFTVVFGAAAFFFMPRSPAACRFLSQQDKHVIEQLLLADGGGETREDPFSWRDVRSAFYSPVVLLMGLSFFASGTTLFGLAGASSVCAWDERSQVFGAADPQSSSLVPCRRWATLRRGHSS